MPVEGKEVGIGNINKYYLEQALLAYSIARKLEKCRKINTILNRVVKNEMQSRCYEKRIKLTHEEYREIFG
jgi:ribosomal protein S3